MASELKRCPKCGGPIPAEAPQGLCPQCLLAEVSLPTEPGGGAPPRSPAPTLEELSRAFLHLEILELIGQGGMGYVFKARQPKLDRLVALKILAHSLAADATFAERFTREGRVLARLNHPNIVTVHDFGQANGFFYLLMEFVDGVNLRQAMRAGRFTPAQALAVVPKVCEALQFAHNEGVLHRDIKPENILIDTKGRVKIADFGIAKLIGEPRAEARLTGSGATLGTPHYMAPEQIERPGEVDHRADIYSLGVVFYEMLTGELPLGRFAPPSQKSGADPRLDDLVFRTLEKEPGRRQQSAGEVKTQLETIATTAASSPAPPAAGWVRPPLESGPGDISTPEHLRTPWASIASVPLMLLGVGVAITIGLMFIYLLLARQGTQLQASTLENFLLLLGSVLAIMIGGMWFWRHRGKKEGREGKQHRMGPWIVVLVLAVITAGVMLTNVLTRSHFDPPEAATSAMETPAGVFVRMEPQQHFPGLVEFSWQCWIPANHVAVFRWTTTSNGVQAVSEALSGFIIAPPEKGLDAVKIEWTLQDGERLSPDLANKQRWDCNIGGMSTGLWVNKLPIPWSTIILGGQISTDPQGHATLPFLAGGGEGPSQFSINLEVQIDPLPQGLTGAQLVGGGTNWMEQLGHYRSGMERYQGRTIEGR